MRRSYKVIIGVSLAAVVAASAAWGWKARRNAVGESAALVTARMGFHVAIYRPGWFGDDVLVYDVRKVDRHERRVEAINAFVAAAGRLRGSVFQTVILACHGKPKFKLNGAYVLQLGRERPYQNPAYTARTFPEHVRTMRDTQPWPEAVGDLPADPEEQMKNVNQFVDAWLSNGPLPRKRYDVEE